MSTNEVADAVRALRDSVTPCLAGRSDETGTHVESLTEAVMGMTAALVQIAAALDGIAEAIRERGAPA
jgi:hypothetical protein